MPTEENVGLQAMNVAEPLYRVKGWIKFNCIMQIIAGCLQVIGGMLLVLKINPMGIVSLLSGFGFIFIAAKLYPTIRFSEAAYEKESEDDVLDLTDAIAFYFKALGILFISYSAAMIGAAILTVVLA